jgi:hypothetical protein
MTEPNDIRDEFSPLLDDELSPEARDTVEAKLSQDADLLRELDAMRKVDALYRGLPRVSAPDDMAARVRNQLHPESNVTPLRTRRTSRSLYSGLAVAALFAVLIGGAVMRLQLESPSAEDQVASLESPVLEAPLEDTAERIMENDFADAVEEELLPSDMPIAAQAAREITLESAPAAEPESSAPSGSAEMKMEAAAAALPPPPPPPPAPREEPTLGRSTSQAIEERDSRGAIVEADGDVSLDAVDKPSPAKQRANEAKRIANREFEQREDGWYQQGYDGEEAQFVRRGSDEMNALVAEIPKFKEVLALEGDIVFRHGTKWYRVTAGAED